MVKLLTRGRYVYSKKTWCPPRTRHYKENFILKLIASFHAKEDYFGDLISSEIVSENEYQKCLPICPPWLQD
jgi:hypothetical protein